MIHVATVVDEGGVSVDGEDEGDDVEDDFSGLFWCWI